MPRCAKGVFRASLGVCRISGIISRLAKFWSSGPIFCRIGYADPFFPTQFYQFLDRARVRQGFQPTSPDARFLVAGELEHVMDKALNSNGVMHIQTPRGCADAQCSDGTILLMPMMQIKPNPLHRTMQPMQQKQARKHVTRHQ